MEVFSLQKILGTDKKNSTFSIYKNPTKPGFFYVCVAFSIIETVKDDPKSFEYKLMVARLFNAGVKRKKLIQIFAGARTTMQRWGDALKSNDITIISRAFAGQGAPKKITEEILSFIQCRFRDIYQDTHYDYSKRIREEINEVFRTTVCGETLRTYFNALKEGKSITKTSNYETGANGCELGKNEKKVFIEEKVENSGGGEFLPVLAKTATPMYSLEFARKRLGILCCHAGVLIYSSFLKALNQGIGQGSQIIMQWIIMILLGFKNVEQSKLMNFESLSIMFGDCTKSRWVQRDTLSELSCDKELVENLFKINSELSRAKSCTDFYFDPHTKHYTGMKQILKGWCSSIRFCDKVMNMDYFHTKEGYPVFVNHEDNFYDMRQRFKVLIGDFRTISGHKENTVLTYIIDRGIYGMEVFSEIVDMKNSELITWQKGYKQGEFEPAKVKGSFTIAKKRNHREDLLIYGFSYMDEAFAKNSDLRKIIVKATNHKGKSVEVAIITTDKNRNAEEIITLMFNRWLQENDFKYLIKHFGIEEITSYSSNPYQQLKGLIEDKDIKSGKYKALVKKIADLEKKLGKILIKQKARKKPDKRQIDNINNLLVELKEVNDEKALNSQKISRLQAVMDEGYVKLDLKSKTLMDSLKIISRNLFYNYFQPFKGLYDNLRDDHVIFRNLTQSHGILLFKKESVEVVLLPTICYSPKLREVIGKFLNTINLTHPVIPDGSNRIITFSLPKKESKLFVLPLPKNYSN